MRRLLRAMLGMRPPFITADRAVEVAREECARRGWTAREEALVSESLRSYSVQFGPFVRKPGGPSVTVDLRTGKVLSFVKYLR